MDNLDYTDDLIKALVVNETPELIVEPKGWLADVLNWLRLNEHYVDGHEMCPTKEAICRALEGLKIGYVCQCGVVVQAGTHTESHQDECQHISKSG